MNQLIELPQEKIANRIFLIRNKKVMFDKDLAELYGVETKVLNQAVKRNLGRFPGDFMFKLNEIEFNVWSKNYLRSQFVTSSVEHGGRRYYPNVFTEQGIAMLSSVLKNEIAIDVNIQIIRTFTKLREIMSVNSDLRNKIEEMERKYDKNFSVIFGAIKKLLSESVEETKEGNGNRVRIGFN